MTAPAAAGRVAAARSVPAAVPVKTPATGRHRASGQATGRHRAPVAGPGATGGTAPMAGGTPTGSVSGRSGGNPRFTPRSSRTRYIRYLGNQDASNTGRLIAEWLAAVVLISIAVPTHGAEKGYQKTMTTIMYRLSALTAVFFVLALMANSKAGKVAVYVGLLIDLGIIFTSYREGTIKKVGNLVSGKPTADTGSSGNAVPQANIFPSSHAVSGGFVALDDSGNPSNTGPAVVSA